ncbi:MAG: tRNA preQ1(34) S-adenosylmethionine ribosyltransferase-isomerase QueA [Desulfuromonadaceae bacterium]|nr:tRNA preQ1(34) S-adenosylmethionine ribosyltransferase-isomerase QueA [Desulfuromonadaceae bacterium]MDD2849695.1 tRNA preQ1(34) S-adenosylmethionine ribosyltransferase-isomerase QueA [Desulfuromonadaceae bacterium]MDD4129798.1 tRNA preQ1(34) S-adenosylmethionine ribosyltransferase-isomerase QueA [Desulfuromonadaceae bacterium]
MLVKDFTFYLPQELIARHPLAARDSSRLMLLGRASGSIAEDTFGNLQKYLRPGDLLVMNDTRVIPARLYGHKPTGGKVEIFLLRRLTGGEEVWECLLRSSKKFREGQEILLESGMTAVVLSRCDSENWLVEFRGEELFQTWLDREGHIPLPPYLQRDDCHLDRERYQTVVAREPGAVAAPTAGLHFTRELLSQLASSGIETAFLTLHTGLGTFQPVRTLHVEEHQIHTERFVISRETADAVNRTKAAGGRVIAVGTTSARTLEYSAQQSGRVEAGSGEADIYIYPGYNFKIIDALVTNFHLPESTLLMLVSALAGREAVLGAYREAVLRGFRFYSYGDAMFIS